MAKMISQMAEKSWENYQYSNPPDGNLYHSVYKDGYVKGANDVLRKIERIYDSETDIIKAITRIHETIEELKGDKQ